MAVKRIIRISYFTLLTVLGALICFKCDGFPITLQAFFAVLSGIALSPTDGAVSQLTYLALGLVGLPVFALGGGYTYVFEPTFGYLVAMILAAYVSGVVFRRFKTLKIWTLFVSGLVGLAAIYILGGAYQVISLITIHGYSAGAAFRSLVCLPLSFAIQAVLLLIVSLVYPRLISTSGAIKEEKFRDSGAALG